jgi:hypothetical protein
MLFISSTQELIRNIQQLKTAVFLHWCLIHAVPLTCVTAIQLFPLSLLQRQNKQAGLSQTNFRASLIFVGKDGSLPKWSTEILAGELSFTESSVTKKTFEMVTRLNLLAIRRRRLSSSSFNDWIFPSA